MKSNIKKYKDFINESITNPKLTDIELERSIKRSDKDFLSELRDDFNDSIMSTINGGSFSDMCKKKSDPDLDYQEMQKEFDEIGWDFKSIKNLFSEEANKLIGLDFMGWFNSSGQLGSNNGYCDVYLYFTAKNLGLDPNQISLGGEGWVHYNEGDELWIRYSYGYHQTKYGQLMLDQIGLTVEEFRDQALDYMQEYIKDHWDSSLLVSVEKALNNRNLPSDLRSFILSIDIKDYTVVEEDRMIIYTTEIASALLKEELVEVNAKDIANNLIEVFHWVDIDMQEIEGDVVIWGKFKVDF
jgi:hypothetical protein